MHICVYIYIYVYLYRAVPVLSYVSQFAIPPLSVNLEALAHRSIHSILRLPPQTFSRALTNTVGFCSSIDPTPLKSYCAAVRYRFAVSEADYLIQLKEDVFAFVGDSVTVSSQALNQIFHGGINSPSILQSLHDALALKGPLSEVHCQIRLNPSHSWILTYPLSVATIPLRGSISVATIPLQGLSALPKECKGVQTAVLRILAGGETCHLYLEQELIKKLRISLGGLFETVHFQPNWLGQINVVFESSNVFLRMCWLKAIGGGWTTSTRMHETVILPCIFGCVDCKDEFRHYMICPIIWQLAKEALGMRESQFDVGHRLCLSSANLNKLKLLGFCHLLYHSLRKDSHCFDHNGLIRSSVVVQRRAFDSFRALIPLIEISCLQDSVPDNLMV